MTRRSHGDRKASGAYANLQRLFDREAILLLAREAALDLSDWDTNRGLRHRPFPKPSKRSSAMDTAWRTSPLASRPKRGGHSGALGACSPCAPGLSVSGRATMAPGGRPGEKFAAARRLAIG